MTIEWNRVTWYSKLIAVIFFLITFAVAFCFGMQYQRLESLPGNREVPVYPVPSEVTLGVGDSAKVGDLTITFNALLNDYRCAIDVQCIQAGAVNTNVTFSTATQTETKNMPSDEVPQEFGKYKISIVAVTPPTHTKRQIQQKDYRVTFRITN